MSDVLYSLGIAAVAGSETQFSKLVVFTLKACKCHTTVKGQLRVG